MSSMTMTHKATSPHRRPPSKQSDKHDTAGTSNWGLCFGIIVAAHIGVLAFVLTPHPEAAEGFPQDAINVDLVPDISEPSQKEDEVPGPPMPEPSTPTDKAEHMDEPDPPAPEAPPPTQAERKPDVVPPPKQETAPPSPEKSEAELPPETKTPPKEKPPEPTPPVEKPPEIKPPEIKKDLQERLTAPSKASTGSEAVLSGGRRPTAAAQATWRSAIGRHLVIRRRYPVAARARGMQGVAKVHVTVDASGHVLGYALAQSSGYPLLDSEALALIQRSDPLPMPPPGTAAPIGLNVPVVFAIR